jgi:hypothetical protein
MKWFLWGFFMIKDIDNLNDVGVVEVFVRLRKWAKEFVHALQNDKEIFFVTWLDTFDSWVKQMIVSAVDKAENLNGDSATGKIEKEMTQTYCTTKRPDISWRTPVKLKRSFWAACDPSAD